MQKFVTEMIATADETIGGNNLRERLSPIFFIGPLAQARHLSPPILSNALPTNGLSIPSSPVWAEQPEARASKTV